MAWRFTRAPGWAFLAALFYSLTSPSVLLVPDGSFSGTAFWGARRLFLMTVWDDTPHMTALALLPLCILFLAASLEKRRLRYYIPTVLLIALMAAASEFGPIEVMMAALCLLCVFRSEEWRRNLATTAALGAFAYVLIAPFLSPSMIRAIGAASGDGREPGLTVGSFSAAAIVAVGWVALMQYLPRWTKDWRLQFFALFAYLTGSVPILAAWLHRQFLPQPARYKSEMELALSLLFAFGLRHWFTRLRRPLQVAIAVLVLGLAAEQVAGYRQYAKGIMQPADVTATIEWRTAQWAAQNLTGTRVFMAGSIAQWTNTFTEVAQFSGASWSKAINPVQQRASAAIYNGGPTPDVDARVSLAWLKAFGVGAIAVSGPASQEFWKPFTHPAKFADLPVLWREDDVTIYRVPQRTPSLAHVVPFAAILRQDPSDISVVQKYVVALDDSSLPAAEMRWNGSNHIDVKTTAGPGQAISLQINYFPGWHARAGGRSLPLHRDGLGLMWFDPQCNGPCEVQLDYDGGWQLRLCHWASLAAFATLLVLPLGVMLRRRSQHM
jgi:hypothetical protein